MEFYALLALATVTIAILSFLTWQKTRSPAFPLGLGMFYYWTLYGAWSLVVDKRGGESGKHYQYLEGKLFAVALDDSYFWALSLYTLFIVALALSVLYFAKPPPVCKPLCEPFREPLREPAFNDSDDDSNKDFQEPHRVLYISHAAILGVCGLAGLLSFLIIRPSLFAAQAMSQSVYVLTKGGTGETPPLFGLHQELTRIALLPAALGLMVFWSGKNPKYIRGERSAWIGIAYLGLLGSLAAFTFVLGVKAEIFTAGITGLLFYLANAERPRIPQLLSLCILGGIGFTLIDALRGVPLPLLYRALTTMNADDMLTSMQFMGTSDEAFGAHFSLYGVLAYHVPYTYGSSFVSLAASIVPRALWENRPEDIYIHYAEGVQAVAGQGYSIHHATAWYLNFGTVGVIMGAILMGWLWATCHNCCQRAHSFSGGRFLLAVICPWTFTAYLPVLIRAGVEAYKGLILEAFLFPVLVIYLAHRASSHERA